jgi:hypothetical protein
MIVYKTTDAKTGCPALITPCIKELGIRSFAYAGIFETEEQRDRFVAENRCVLRAWPGND